MNFATDRDLLMLEPNLFVDVPFLSQQRLRVTDGVLSGTTLTSVTADFSAARVEAGSVVLIGRTGEMAVAHEVIGCPDAHTLTVSLPRSAVGDPAIASRSGTGLEVTVRTFTPQAALVHNVLLQMLELDPVSAVPGQGEDAIVSLSVMSRLEVLGTLEQIYTAAAGLLGDSSNLMRKAKFYQERFASGVRKATVLLDLDGDGYADVRRRLDVVNLVRV